LGCTGVCHDHAGHTTVAQPVTQDIRILPAEDPETGPKQPLAAGKVHRLHDRHRRPQKIGLALRQESQLSAGGVGVPVGANLDRPT
jgi:hypothetical protein